MLSGNLTFTYNSGNNIMKQFNILYSFNSPHVNRDLISSIVKFVHELPHKLPNDFRLTIIGNLEISGKSQNWLGVEPSVQSPFEK